MKNLLTRTTLAACTLGVLAAAGPTAVAQTSSLDQARTSTAGVTTVATAAERPTTQARTKKLLVRYRTTSACTVVPNYPKSGVVGNDTRDFTIAAGKSIIWRYNVNSTWALVSDPARASARTYPWWGFTPKSCIGASIKQSGYPAGQPVPSRILQGRSQRASGWRSVDFNASSATKRGRVKAVNSATLRDSANFVTGNVPAGWSVDKTSVTRSNGHWIKVWVPNAERWGWIEADKLR
jgi:hypothetical protein